MKTQRRELDNSRAATFRLHPFSSAPGSAPGPAIEIDPGREYILGRSRTVDIPLDDEKSSRRHCRVFSREGTLMLADLGSINGTLLNGKPVEAEIAMRDGDVIRIGRTEFRLSVELAVSPEGQTWWYTKQAKVEAVTAPPDRTGNTEQWMSGTLKSVSIVDLLQLLSTSQKSALLTLKQKDDCGRLYLRDGQIVRATFNDQSAPQPLKTVLRLLGWQTGRFELSPLKELPAGQDLEISTSAILLEGMQLADELGEIAAELPANHARLNLAKPLPEPLRGLAPEELDLVQLVLEHDSWLAVQDHFPESDLEAGKLLITLQKRGLIVTG